MLAPRLEDLEVIYVSGNESEVVETLARYGARYLYIGAYERDRYGLGDGRLAQLSAWLEPAMSSGDVRVLRVPGVDWASETQQKDARCSWRPRGIIVGLARACSASEPDAIWCAPPCCDG